jgi:hypothetical protein
MAYGQNRLSNNGNIAVIVAPPKSLSVLLEKHKWVKVVYTNHPIHRVLALSPLVITKRAPLKSAALYNALPMIPRDGVSFHRANVTTFYA